MSIGNKYNTHRHNTKQEPCFT